jgi:ATP-dependent Zn protease
MNKKSVKKGLTPYLVILLIMAGILYFISANNKKINYLTYDKFINHMNNGEIKNIKITPKSNARVYEISGK